MFRVEEGKIKKKKKEKQTTGLMGGSIFNYNYNYKTTKKEEESNPAKT